MTDLKQRAMSLPSRRSCFYLLVGIDMWVQPKYMLRHEVMPREYPDNWWPLQIQQRAKFQWCYGKMSYFHFLEKEGITIVGWYFNHRRSTFFLMKSRIFSFISECKQSKIMKNRIILQNYRQLKSQNFISVGPWD